MPRKSSHRPDAKIFEDTERKVGSSQRQGVAVARGRESGSEQALQRHSNRSSEAGFGYDDGS